MSYLKVIQKLAIVASFFAGGSAHAFSCPSVIGDVKLDIPHTSSDLCYSKFVVRYNYKFNGPDYSIMVIDPAVQNDTPRKSNWKIDNRLAVLPNYKTYPDTSVFDKGHLSPADVMSDAQSMADSFNLSNQAPQYYQCNRGMWSKYEADTLKYAERIGRPITTITGVKYDKPSTDGSPSIPTHYWKLVIDKDKMFAFILPNDPIKCSKKTNPTGDFSPVTYQELTDFLGYKLLK
jgi:DNA/RNA endonuclease G (NUC1)